MTKPRGADITTAAPLNDIPTTKALGGAGAPADAAVGIKAGSSLKREITLKMSVIARQLHKKFDQSVAKLGVTRSQWTLIAVVSRYPGLTQREIADRLEITEASAGRLIDRLCAEGFLERRAKDGDRRAYCIYMTAAALPLTEALSKLGREYEAVAFASFDDDELVLLQSFLDRIYANIGEHR